MSMKSKKEVEAIVSGMGVFMAFISNLVELVKKFGGTMENIYRLATPDGNETLEAIARIIAGGVKNVKNEFLKLISGNETLVIDNCDGSEGLANASDLFAWIDSDFRNYGADQKGQATGETSVRVHEMTRNATFSQMFVSLNADMEKICLTPHQIKKFVKKYRNWLRIDGYATFFLFKLNNQFFVAGVSFDSDGKLRVYVDRFERDNVWRAEDRRRVVVPQLDVAQ